ncbi:MAG: hypothetical protein U1E51_16960 [Candidatus Binatia bacterium]|nr:hypothetical protein [Candidatus Binatia bacterium]
MRALMALAVVLLSGCGLNPKPLTNQQIVEQTEYCRDHGLKPVLLIDGLSGRAAAIGCRP